jgi:hypothetical protein
MPRPRLLLAKFQQRIAEVILRRGPFQREAIARVFLQHRAVGRHRLTQRFVLPALLTKGLQRIAEDESDLCDVLSTPFLSLGCTE